jgi:hypothetical protein
MQRLYDNTWYVTHADEATRAELAADVTRAWMAREAAHDAANRARSEGTTTYALSALALSAGNASQAYYDRARSRAAEAARCTDIIDGHAFAITRDSDLGGATVTLESCTLGRHVTMRRATGGLTWSATMTDPSSRHAPTFTTDLGPDDPLAERRACDWILTGLI